MTIFFRADAWEAARTANSNAAAAWLLAAAYKGPDTDQTHPTPVSYTHLTLPTKA